MRRRNLHRRGCSHVGGADQLHHFPPFKSLIFGPFTDAGAGAVGPARGRTVFTSRLRFLRLARTDYRVIPHFEFNVN